MKKFFTTYKYALIIGLQGLIFYFLFDNKVLLFGGLGLCVIAFISSKFLQRLTQIEEFIVDSISKIINATLLSIVYILILLPIGIIKNIFGEKNKNDSFVLTNKTYTKEDLNNPW